jgi:ethanolamine utilization microcompartment shell protein EutL
VVLKWAVCAQPSAGMLGQQRAGFGGRRVGSLPSFSALGSWRTVAEVNVALRRFLPVGKAHAGSALAGQVVWTLAGRRSLDM